MEPSTVTFDRRLIYRPFLERLNPSSPGMLGAQNLIVPPEHDPRDPDQPPIHVAFANAAELNRGVQMALVGGIGSGKTTELWLTEKLLKRHPDAINIVIDLAEMTDLNGLNPGAILIAIGMQLYRRIKAPERSKGVNLAFRKLQELANGTTEWIEVYQPDYPDDDPGSDDDDPERDFVQPDTPGLLKPRFPPIQRKVEEVRH